MSKVTIEEQVMFYDTDCGRVVSNIAYLRYIEKARTALFDSLGMNVAQMEETQLFPVVSRTEIDYRRPIKLGEWLLVTAEIEEWQKVRIPCTFAIESRDNRTKEGQAICYAEARQTVALVQMPEGRPQRVPTEWLKIPLRNSE